MQGYEFYLPKKWLSPHGLCAFCRCPRYWFYLEGCNLRSQSKAPALLFGGCIHRGIPYAIKGDIIRAVDEFCKEWKAEYQDDKRNVMQAKAIFENFYDCHRDGKSIYIPLTAPEGRLKTPEHNTEYEVPFAVDIGLDVPIVGLVDCLATHVNTHKKWIVEMKTSSQLGEQFQQSFEINVQVLTYAMAMKILLGEEIEGVFVEGLLVSKNCNTTVVPIYIKDFLIEKHIAFIKRKYAELKQYETEENFPQDFSGCNQISMFGLPGYNCPYISLCNTTPNWTDLRDLYVIEPRKETPF